MSALWRTSDNGNTARRGWHASYVARASTKTETLPNYYCGGKVILGTEAKGAPRYDGWPRRWAIQRLHHQNMSRRIRGREETYSFARVVGEEGSNSMAQVPHRNHATLVPQRHRLAAYVFEVTLVTKTTRDRRLHAYITSHTSNLQTNNLNIMLK